MIDSLTSYSDYRPAQLPGLGRIPAHWIEKRAKYFYREIDERSTTGEEELLSVSHKTGVTPRPQHVTMFKAESNVGHKICRPEDLVINTMWAFMAALGVARQVGVVSPSYGVYRPLRPGILHREYADRLLRTESYKSEYLIRSTGIRSSRLRLYPDEFLRIPVLCPPPDEQAAIVRFLDHVDRRIRRYIRAKRQLISLLSEQKQAIIHRAVTRGLDPNVPLKPSGVEWLGDVPEHWQLRRLKFLAHIKTGGRDTVDRQDHGTYPFFVRSQKVERIDSYSFDGEAVLTAGDGAGVAKVFHYVDGKFDYHQRVYKFSNFRGIRGRFFFHYFGNTLKFEAFRETAKSTVDSLRLPMLQNFPVVLPPAEEQLRIIELIDRDISRIDTAADAIASEITLLREYRTRLIADVVTGKMDVREAAARLPDEVDEGDSSADELVDGEDVLDDVELVDAEPEEAEA